MRILAWPAFSNREHNPYQSLLYSEVQRLGLQVDEFTARAALLSRHDVWHLHWPEVHLGEPLPKAFLKDQVLLWLLRRARRRGIKIFWTAHNLHTHEQRFPRLEAHFWKEFIPLVDGVFALTAAGLRQARAAWPSLHEVPGFVTPHGHYRDAYATDISRAEARRRLSVPDTARVLLFLGKVRAYKGIPELIAAFEQTVERDLMLFIVGSPEINELKHEIEEAAGSDDRIRLHLDYVPDQEIQLYMRVADCMVLPYREVFNSGTALLALSFDLPILAPLSVAIDDLHSAYGDRWVRTFSLPIGPSDLEVAGRWSADHDGTSVPLQDRDWGAIAQQTVAGYEEIRRPSA